MTGQPPTVIVLDYDAGNLRSVVRAVAHAAPRVDAALDVQVTHEPRALDTADAVILPGVGAAEDTMRNLQERGLVAPIQDYIASGRPFLGVCMGLQALMTVSEEGGEHPCLNVVPGRVVRLPAGRKVPHMGWNAVRQLRPHAMFTGIPDEAHFYFVHSYYCVPDEPSVTLATTDYGTTVTAVVERANVIATQFHPEKSGPHGLRFYRNFLASVVGAVGAPARA
jgi:glutamine amidotransferase